MQIYLFALKCLDILFICDIEVSVKMISSMNYFSTHNPVNDLRY